MKQGQEQRAYKLKFTNTGFKFKPQGDDWYGISNTLKGGKPLLITLKKLVDIIEQGNCFLLAQFNDSYGYKKENIINIPAIALDIDKGTITMQELTEEIYKDFNIRPVVSYPTFSDTNYTNFRLIYEFEEPVSADEYERIYEGLIYKYKDYLDHKTKNSTRLWCGTNKKCLYSDNAGVITAEIIEKILSCIPKEEPKEREYKLKTESKPIDHNNALYNKFYIKGKYKDEVLELLHRSIDIHDFIVKHFGGSFKDKGRYLQGCCPLHGGDNPTAFYIDKHTNLYTCFTNCNPAKGKETGNIITAAYKAFNSNDFSSVAIELLQMYEIEIEEDYIGIKKGDL